MRQSGPLSSNHLLLDANGGKNVPTRVAAADDTRMSQVRWEEEVSKATK